LSEFAKYCINEIGYTMTSIGVDDGGVFIANEIEKDIYNIIRAFSKDDANRKVIIVKYVNKSMKRFLQAYFNELHLNIIYDATLVITNKRTNNEKYIALTRALVNSYIIN